MTADRLNSDRPDPLRAVPARDRRAAEEAARDVNQDARGMSTSGGRA